MEKLLDMFAPRVYKNLMSGRPEYSKGVPEPDSSKTRRPGFLEEFFGLLRAQICPPLFWQGYMREGDIYISIDDRLTPPKGRLKLRQIFPSILGRLKHRGNTSKLE